MPTLKHVHKYRRVNIGKKKKYYVYACQLKGCTHHLPQEHLLLGRENICWSCGETFTATIKTIGLARPHCAKPDCHKHTYKGRKPLSKTQQAGMDILDELDL